MKSGLIIDRYVLEKPISNNGGTASVWLAHLQSDARYKVAIKVAHTEVSNNSHEDVLLQWEAEHLQKWDWRHPGIVRIFPTPVAQGVRPRYAVRAVELKDRPWYMVMEYLRGKSLFDNRDVISKCPLEWKLELFYRILESVAFLHQKGFAHRDIKPDNIVFREPISQHVSPQPVLIDFALTSNGSEEREIVDSSFTLEYAARERILRSMDVAEVPAVDVLGEDIWSLGAILYEIITGQPLFKGNRDKVRTTIIRHGLNIVLPEHDTRYEILTEFIRAMLAKDPADRPNARALLSALEEEFLPPRIVIQ